LLRNKKKQCQNIFKNALNIEYYQVLNIKNEYLIHDNTFNKNNTNLIAMRVM